MRLSLITSSVIFFTLLPLNGQVSDSASFDEQKIRKNSIYFELMGNGVVYSINYDRIVFTRERTSMLLRVGVNEYHGSSTDTLSFNIISAAGILYGGPRHYVEPSLGFTFFSGSPDRLIIFSGGYRFQGRNGLTFRATPMLVLNTETGDTFGNSLWIGISLGYSF